MPANSVYLARRGSPRCCAGLGPRAHPLLFSRRTEPPRRPPSRLQSVAKEQGVQIVMSSDVASYAGCLKDAGTILIVKVRGVAQPMQLIGVSRGRDLPASILIATEGEDNGTGRRGSTQGMPVSP